MEKGVSIAALTLDLKASPINTANTAKHIPALDGMRGFAVLLVIAFHYGDVSQFHHPIMRVLDAIKSAGWVGVDIFFALSGFLITSIVWDSKDKPHRVRNFYSRRALRLFPMYYGIWALLLIYVFATHLPWSNSYFAYLLYFGNVASVYNQTQAVGVFQISHLWSLAVEEQFYLIWPFVLWKLGNIRTAMKVLAGAIFFSILLKLVLLLEMHVGRQWDYRLLPTHIEGLALGSMLALAMQIPAWRPSLSTAGRYLPLVLAVLLGEMVYFHGLSLGNHLVTFFAVPLLSLASTLLIWNTLIQGSIYQRIMQMPILRFYGRYSYGLYLYHYLLRQVMKKALYGPILNTLHSPALSGVLYLICCMIFFTILAVASFHLYEAPFLKMKRYFVM